MSCCGGCTPDNWNPDEHTCEQPTEPLDVAALLKAVSKANDHGCSPGNGGIGGVIPWCRACGAMMPPMVPCDRPNCDHRIIG